MVPHACFPETSNYSVEVSGWDCDQTFFVEKTDLKWSESSGKHLVLRRFLLDKAIIFVRLVQPNDSDRSYPVPYEAIAMQAPGAGGHTYRLNAVHPCLREA